ncbi:hypothetical protein N177_3406 [Lutibaculum baratangense AMV1]|uniref:Uncharacterized protein n=1 Tax=Lutibaculum baratangense AMV1 TaxID=631454 RepID=V4TA24_9HYPH|nr:hypothetical protein N177_3406 [Lutibaculum baratangense AMV1]
MIAPPPFSLHDPVAEEAADAPSGRHQPVPPAGRRHRRNLPAGPRPAARPTSPARTGRAGGGHTKRRSGTTRW